MSFDKRAVISGRYKVVDGPFRGGMAEVYKVWGWERETSLAPSKLSPCARWSKCHIICVPKYLGRNGL